MLEVRTCFCCGKSLLSKRLGAKTCSVRCRKNLSRKRGYYEMLQKKELSIQQAVIKGRRFLEKL